MPDAYFIVFELVVAILFFLCLRHAWQRGLPVVWQLLAGVLFGLLLEWATIQQLHAYQYGRFLLMLGEVPVAIGVAWGTIIYTARLFSDATSLPAWVRPVLDGLLGLNIDLAMDAIAIRLGMWDWGLGFERQFFGVPYANFWAWFWVVFSFSMGLRLLTRLPGWAGRWLAPPGAILAGVAGVLVTNRFIANLSSNYSLYVAVVIGTLCAALLLVLTLRPALHIRPLAPEAAWVPLGYHAYFLAAGLLSGAALRPPFLLVVGLTMALAGVWLHRPPMQRAHAVAAVYPLQEGREDPP